MRRRPALVVAAGVVAAALLGAVPAQAAAAAAAPTVTVRALTGGNDVYGINDLGVAVGTAAGPNNTGHAVVWKRSTAGTVLPGTYTRANFVNDRGQIVSGFPEFAAFWPSSTQTPVAVGPSGTDAVWLNQQGQVLIIYSAAGSSVPAWGIWDNGTITPLAVDNNFALLSQLNNRGDAVGGFVSTPFLQPSAAYLWKDGVRTPTPPPSGFVTTVATAVNDNDLVLGAGINPATGAGQAYVWQNGTSTWLGSLGGGSSSTPSTGFAPSVPETPSSSPINDLGQVVGTSTTADGSLHAFRWQRGVMTDLGTLPGDTSSAATAVNALGEVVGTSTGPTGTHAFAWWNGRMVALPPLVAGQPAEVRGINALGQIIGFSGGPTLWQVTWR